MLHYLLVIVVELVSAEDKVSPLPVVRVDHPLGGQPPEVAAQGGAWDLGNCRNILTTSRWVNKNVRTMFWDLIEGFSAIFMTGCCKMCGYRAKLQTQELDYNIFIFIQSNLKCHTIKTSSSCMCTIVKVGGILFFRTLLENVMLKAFSILWVVDLWLPGWEHWLIYFHWALNWQIWLSQILSFIYIE